MIGCRSRTTVRIAMLGMALAACSASVRAAEPVAHKFTFRGQQVRVVTAFDNGALAKVEERERNVLDCWPCDNCNFHFRLEGCRNQKVVLRFHVAEGRAGGVSPLYANPDFPVFSYDRKQWQRTLNKSLADDPQRAGSKIVRVEQTFTEDTAWLAFQYPYSNDLLSEFIAGIKDSPFVTLEKAGRSAEGREIRQICVTDPAVPIDRKKVAWFTGIQHCRETGAGWGLEAMLRFLLSTDPAAAEARSKFVFKVIPIVNVDALAEGLGRIHSSGRNLNREWERPDPTPEIASIQETLDQWKSQGHPIDVFIDFHGFSATLGRWTAVVMPQGTYTGQQAKDYGRLLQAIQSRVPPIRCGANEAKGYAQGAGCRRWKALSLSVDGWVYADPSGKTASLSSRYDRDAGIMALDDLRAAGESFLRALLDFSAADFDILAGDPSFQTYPMQALAPTVAAILGVPAPKQAEAPPVAPAVRDLRGAKRVALLGVDAFGAAIWGKTRGKTPYLNSIALKNNQARVRSVMPSVTCVNFGCMITGGSQKTTGIKTFNSELACENLCTVLRAHGMKSGGFGIKDWTGDRLLGRYADFTVKDKADDQEVLAGLMKLVEEKKPEFVIVQFGETDKVFHTHGPFSAEAAEACVHADAWLAKIVPWLRARGYAILITADHGQHEVARKNGKTSGKHGTASNLDSLVPLVWLPANR